MIEHSPQILASEQKYHHQPPPRQRAEHSLSWRDVDCYLDLIPSSQSTWRYLSGISLFPSPSSSRFFPPSPSLDLGYRQYLSEGNFVINKTSNALVRSTT